MSNAGRKYGFTIIELAAVLVIISIVAAIAVPRYNTALSRYRAQFAAQRIAADLELVQNDARAQSAAKQIDFDTINNKHTISDITDFDGKTGAYTVDLSAAPYYADVTAVFMSSGQQSVIFDGHGLPNATGFIVVVVGGFQHIINVYQDSGKILVN